jgi:low temperature requirement protein LtrA
MAAMLVVALAVPRAFGSDGVTFGVSYFIVRAILLVLYGVAGRGNRDLLRSVLKIVPAGILGPGLLVVAGFTHGSAQLMLWGAALIIDYLGVLVGDVGAWSISPEHFVERNGLIIIIALGESIFAIGIGAAGLPLDAGVIAAALLGVAIAAALWWSYFDWVAYVAQATLAETAGAKRAALARDAYSYLHLPMVAGIVLFALGLKTSLANVSGSLGTIPALGLCGGVALYLLAHIALRLRIQGGFGRGRPMATVLLIGLFPLVRHVSAVSALALVLVACASLIGYEAIRHRESRAFIRSRRGEFTVEEVRAYIGEHEGRSARGNRSDHAT